MSENNKSGEKIVSDSIAIFTKVDKKINELIDCSVKDFELLNNSFKKYFSSLEVISKASKSFTFFLSSLNDDEDFVHLKNQDEISKLSLNNSISTFLSNIKKLEEKLNYYLLIIKNLSQDLSTIRLLFSNLRFDPFIETDNAIANQQIKSTAESLSKLESEINSLHSILNNIIIFVDEGFISALELYIEQFEIIKDCYNHIGQLSIVAKKHLLQINELEEKRNSSASEIITNLQFQDIIRQKIEHVQEAHEELRNDLIKVKDEEDSLNPEKLFQIRDITTLQSAQLIHSNQEYQTAVETILSKISELNTLLNKYQSIWNHFCIPERSKLLSIKSRLREHINILNTQSFSLTHIAEKFESNIDMLSNKINNLHKYLNKGKFELNSFSKLQETFMKLEEKYSDSEKYNALKQLKFELNKFETEYTKLDDELNNFKVNFTNNKIIPLEDYKQDVKIIIEFSERNSKYFTNSLSNEIDGLFKTPVEIHSNNSFNIKGGSYYKNFEDEIGKIITLFDNLLLKINIGKNDIDIKTLEHLKKNYTMESERRVHNLISQQNNTNTVDKSKKDKDGIEFF